MSSSDDFETQDFQFEIDQPDQGRPLSVKRYLENPKQLMQKILFTSFKVDPFFPLEFSPLPDMMKPDTAQKDTNNMNLIQQSTFRHQKLKKDIFGFLLSSNINSKPTTRKNLPTMQQYYQGKTPMYEKYAQNMKSKCMATYLLDSKSIIKQQIKKNTQAVIFNSQHHHNQSLATHRNKIQFSSNFQCGNLFRAYQVQYNQFDLVLQNDINTRGNNQWFFFMVKNVPKGLTIKFNIVNLSKKYSLFDSGMKPYVFSMVRFEKRKVGWVREGTKILYEENDKFGRQVGQKSYYKLSFEYKFNYEGDVLYFSHSIPYRASDLANFIMVHIRQPKNSRLIKFKDLNRTLGNQDLDVIEISDEQSRENKKIIWIIARQHSGEVTSSFMMEGVINFLLGGSNKAKELLRKYVFKVVPMINIDGVIHGNSRAQLSGADPNRKWLNPHKIRNPVIWALKKYIEKDKGRIEMFLDLHSHSRKLGTFFYGNTFRDNKYSTRKYPWMVCKKDERFTYSQCRFSQCNLSSARHVLFESLKIPLIYTVESSFYGYQKNDHRIIEYLPNDYRQMGQTLMQTFWEHSLAGSSPSSMSMYGVEDKKFIQQVDENQDNDKQSIGSDSDPGEDQFQDKELKKLLPNFFGVKNTKKKVIKKVKNKQKQKKQKKTQREEIVTPIIKSKKNEKESHYRIYFSGRQSCMEKRGISSKASIQTKQYAVQASIPDNSILKGSINTSVTTLLQKRPSLCIWGQKVEEQVSVFGNVVGLQVDMLKVFQNKEQARKSLPARKSFKLSSKISSILQVKQNNFLNRADCHTVPLRSASRK